MQKLEHWNGIPKNLMSINHKSIIYYFTLLFFLLTCTDGESEKVYHQFDYRLLEKAWENKDSAVVLKWINSLSDSTLTYEEFYDRVSDLSSTTNFVFGNADYSEHIFWEKPKWLRKIYIYNTAKVYCIYSQSCLFMKETTWNKTLPLQDNYWNDSTVLSFKEIELIRIAIDSICNK